MESQAVYDANGNAYQVYRTKLSDGSYLDVDVKLANMWRYGSKHFVDREVALAEQVIKEG